MITEQEIINEVNILYDKYIPWPINTNVTEKHMNNENDSTFSETLNSFVYNYVFWSDDKIKEKYDAVFRNNKEVLLKATNIIKRMLCTSHGLKGYPYPEVFSLTDMEDIIRGVEEHIQTPKHLQEMIDDDYWYKLYEKIEFMDRKKYDEELINKKYKSFKFSLENKENITLSDCLEAFKEGASCILSNDLLIGSLFAVRKLLYDSLYIDNLKSKNSENLQENIEVATRIVEKIIEEHFKKNLPSTISKDYIEKTTKEYIIERLQTYANHEDLITALEFGKNNKDGYCFDEFDLVNLSEISYSDEEIKKIKQIKFLIKQRHKCNCNGVVIKNKRDKKQFFIQIDEGLNGNGDFVYNDMTNIYFTLLMLKNKNLVKWVSLTDVFVDIADDLTCWTITYTL